MAMSAYRFLLAHSERPGFLDTATIDQPRGAALIGHRYSDTVALELWREPWQRVLLSPANDVVLSSAS